MEAAPLRLRVKFEDPGILSKSQKKEGLKRSWVLLKPQLHTISDVVSYLLHCFHLFDSCPDGIILAMGGFVLPPFESTAILKDEDLICVKRKRAKLLDVTKEVEGAKTSDEDEIVEKQPLPSGVRLLTGEKCDEETGGYQSETDEDEDEAEGDILRLENVPVGDVASKKREAPCKIESSKTKRQRQATHESGLKKHAHTCKGMPRKESKNENGNKRSSVPKPKAVVPCSKHIEPTSDIDEPDESKERTTPISQEHDGAKKVSRSTRRKRLQRMWRKLHRAKDRMDKACEGQLPVSNCNADSGSKKSMSTKVIDHALEDEESDADGDLVPVVIRPGHIRFAPSGKVKDVQQDQASNGWDVLPTDKTVWECQSVKKTAWGVGKNKDAFQWNGITNKRKGQKWGKEKQPTTSWKERRDYNVSPSFPQQDNPSSHEGRPRETFEWNETTNKRKGQMWGKKKQPTSSWKDSRDYDAHTSDTLWKKYGDYSAYSSGTWTAKKQLKSDAVVDFVKLVPLTDLPKAGDVVAYRLLELSSSWCPELSSFRIGKISWFELESNRIMLVPVPEYPLNIEKKTCGDVDDSASGHPPGSSMYNEEGSLEIDFSSLVDVRIVKRDDLSYLENTAAQTANGTPDPSGTSRSVNETQTGSKNIALDVGNGQLETPTSVNGKKDVWEEISEALSAKKAQLTQEDSWNKKESSAKRSWSYRTLRSSGLGPTMAMLRVQNGI